MEIGLKAIEVALIFMSVIYLGITYLTMKQSSNKSIKRWKTAISSVAFTLIGMHFILQINMGENYSDTMLLMVLWVINIVVNVLIMDD